MKLRFTARHTELMPDMDRYCRRRLAALEKLLGKTVDADVLLSVEKARQKVEITLRTGKSVLHAEEETHDMNQSLTRAFDRIEKRLKKEREKLRERKRRRNREPEAFSAMPEAGGPGPRVIRSRSYTPKPMSVEEAVEQLEAQKEDVFLFRTIGKEQWAVLFRRKDGNYGLVEPD